MKAIAISTCAMLLSYASPLLADTADKVRQAIEASMQGECSDVLSTMVKTACEGQTAQAANIYQRLGALNELIFKGYESTPNGKAEVYQAIHQNGKMLWLIIEAPDGRLSTFWSPGPTQ
ncbi:hypothetical protein D9M68_336580 [compost metagenome]